MNRTAARGSRQPNGLRSASFAVGFEGPAASALIFRTTSPPTTAILWIRRGGPVGAGAVSNQRSRRRENHEGLLGPLITTGKGPAAWVIPTNEELVIAGQVRKQAVLSRRGAPARGHGGRVMEGVNAKPVVTPKADELGD